MYKLVEAKRGIGGFYINNKYIVYTEEALQGRIKVYTHTNEVIFLSEQEWINRFCVIGNNLCYSSYDENFTRIQTLKNDKSITLDTLLFGITSNSPNIYDNFYYNLSEKIGKENGSIYDLLTGKKIKNVDKPILGFIELNTTKHIVTQKDAYIYIYIKNDFSLLWQKDLSEIASYTDWDGYHKGNVKNAYLFENKLIVVAGNSLLAMDIEKGDILWQIKYVDFQPFTLHINKNFAYLSKGVFYSVIDLEKGEKVLETKLIRPFDHDDRYQNANLAMVGSDMTFYDNFLYFSDKHKGRYYLAKLNPQTAQIEDYQFLDDVKSNLAPPKFYDDKMFLLDSNNNLFIYERE